MQKEKCTTPYMVGKIHTKMELLGDLQKLFSSVGYWGIPITKKMVVRRRGLQTQLNHHLVMRLSGWRMPARSANNLPPTCRPIGGRRLRAALPLTTTLLFLAWADCVAASFVPPKLRPAVVAMMSSSRSLPPIGASAGAGVPRRTIHPDGGSFGLEDFDDNGDTTTSEIVDYGGGGGATDHSRSIDRNDRRLFLSSLFASSLPLGFFMTPSPAFAAAKGAAEYDLEYYMRDLL